MLFNVSDKPWIKYSLLLFLTLCIYPASHAYPLVTAQLSTSSIYAITTPAQLYLPRFSAINAVGSVQIIINGQQANQKITVTPYASAYQQPTQFVNIIVKNQILWIDARAVDSETPLLVKIDTPFPITQLTLHGNSSVAAHFINNTVNISLNDSASAYLSQIPLLHLVENNSIGNLTATDINTSVLSVSGYGSGLIVLTGKTDHLYAHLHNTLQLDTAKLTTSDTHILTQNQAIAYVNPIEALYGFAYDDSNIYYYRRPSQLVEKTQNSGNVLKIEQ